MFNKRARAHYWVLFLLTILTGATLFDAGQSVARSETVTPYQSGAYHLGINDIVTVTVFGEKDLSGQYQVQADGMLNLPLIGAILVSGLTASEAEQAIAHAFAGGYLVDPNVTIQIDQRRSFYIMGEVKNPGQYEYKDDMTALNAVALAGGFTYRAKKNAFKLMRKSEQNAEIPDDNYQKVSTKTALAPGDVLLIEERFF